MRIAATPTKKSWTISITALTSLASSHLLYSENTFVRLEFLASDYQAPVNLI
jgi:hypothetical protein